jgi:hypothetical protein
MWKPSFQCTFCSRELKRNSTGNAMSSASICLDSAPGYAPPLSPLSNLGSSGALDTRSLSVSSADMLPHPNRTSSPTSSSIVLEDRLVNEPYARKDHLWQHLYKFHGCRKWEGWTLDLVSLRMTSDAINSRCGFCHVAMGESNI